VLAQDRVRDANETSAEYSESYIESTQ